MGPIRVLHILHSMNRGGAENAIMNYYRNIDHSKVQFDFLLTAKDKCQFEDEIERLGGRVFRVPQMTIRNPFPYLKGVLRFFKEHKEYRIVHSHTSSKSFFPLYLARKAGIPVRICHSHNTKTEQGTSGRIRNLLKFPLRMVATDYCACGEEAAVWLYGKALVESGRVMIVPNVIEAGLFDYEPSVRARIRKEMGVPDSTVILGCTARFNDQKNHRFLISLFNEFHRMVCDSRLLLIGDGRLRNDIQSQVDDLGLRNSVVFTGVVPNVAEYEQAMDFFMLPSINEGIPLSLIEAQISGLRCFASEGVPRESDKTGLVSFIPLEKGPKYWADSVVSSIGYERRSRIDDINKAGYNAPTASRRLQFYYQKRYSDIDQLDHDSVRTDQ